MTKIATSPAASLWGDVWKRFKKNKTAYTSLIFLILLGLMAIFAPQVTPFSYEEQDISRQLLGPNHINWMGTDSLGRDLYSRIIYGARMSLAVGVIVAFIAFVIGTLYGALGGYVGGRLDHLFMRICDILDTFPSLLLMILILTFTRRSLFGIFFALSIVGWVREARLVRGQVLQVKEMTYIEAARAVGTRGWVIVLRHVLPNILGPLIVTLTFQIPQAMLAEAFLSFIGLGLPPPFSSWGTLASEGWRALRSYPHLIIFPGSAIFVTMLAFNFLGDGLRDAIDPHLKD
ncbi:MAG: ABC transporter permease [Deltaproteobacteria bacterium]|nr:ABC transporter permease [Deltaproteobacteria bacterium]